MKEWKLIGILVLQLFVAIGSSIGVLLLIKKVYVETDFDYGFFAIIHFVLGVLFLFLEVLYWPLFMIVALSWWGVFKTTKKIFEQ
jgi:hypothetical protein